LVTYSSFLLEVMGVLFDGAEGGLDGGEFEFSGFGGRGGASELGKTHGVVGIDGVGESGGGKEAILAGVEVDG
jgi:hypothetical protein